MKRVILVGGICLLSLPLFGSSITCITGPCTGPTSTYYATDGIASKLFIIQGLNDTTVSTTPPGTFPSDPSSNGRTEQYAIAVQNTVRIQSRFQGGIGAEYTLAG